MTVKAQIADAKRRLRGMLPHTGAQDAGGLLMRWVLLLAATAVLIAGCENAEGRRLRVPRLHSRESGYAGDMRYFMDERVGLCYVWIDSTHTPLFSWVPCTENVKEWIRVDRNIP